MKQFDIWMSGYLATGMEGIPSKARKIATVESTNFKDACVEFSKTEEAKGYGHFNIDNLTLWGCGLFDNESDARKAWG